MNTDLLGIRFFLFTIFGLMIVEDFIQKKYLGMKVLADDKVVPRPKACIVKKRGFTQKQITEVVDRHNKLRQKVAGGKQQKFKSASDMKEVSWHKELAAHAQEWVDNCNTEKTPSVQRKIVLGQMGQNLYEEKCLPKCKGSPNFNAMINDWYNQANKQDANPSIIKAFSKFKSNICQFTQLIWSRTKFVGCGYALIQTSNTTQSHLLTCNYFPSGNIVGPAEFVYLEGAPCANCAKCSKTFAGLCAE